MWLQIRCLVLIIGSMGCQAVASEQNQDFSYRLTVYTDRMAQELVFCLASKSSSSGAFTGCGDWGEAVGAMWALMWHSHVRGTNRFDPFIDTRLSAYRLEQEVHQIYRRQYLHSTESLSWVLPLYFLDRKVNQTERLKELVTFVVLAISDRMRQALSAERVTLSEYGLACVFLRDYAYFIEDEYYLSLAESVVDMGLKACQEKDQCAQGWGRLWSLANGGEEGGELLNEDLDKLTLSGDAYSLFWRTVMAAQREKMSGAAQQNKVPPSLTAHVMKWFSSSTTHPKINIYGLWALLPLYEEEK